MIPAWWLVKGNVSAKSQSPVKLDIYLHLAIQLDNNLSIQQERASLIFIFQFFVRLEHIRKCFTMKEGIFVLEEYSKFVKIIPSLKKYWNCWIFSSEEQKNRTKKIQISDGKYLIIFPEANI